MKTQFRFCKSLFLLVISSFLMLHNSIAQSKGVLPLTGLKFFNEGITVKRIDVKIDGAQLLSNRVPLDKEITIELLDASGFTIDNAKTAYAAAEVLVFSPTGELLSKESDIFAKDRAAGFKPRDLNALSIRFAIASALMKNNFNGTVKIRLFDQKGKNQLRFDIPVTFAKMGERLQVSKLIKNINSADGVKGVLNGLEATKMVVKVDTSIKVSPKMAYTSMDIFKIEGSSIAEIFKGKETFWVFDSNLNEVKISDILLKQVKGAMENNSVDYTLKIPYRLKTSTGNAYIVRFRWESPDKSQVIDIVVNI